MSKNSGSPCLGCRRRVIIARDGYCPLCFNQLVLPIDITECPEIPTSNSDSVGRDW